MGLKTEAPLLTIGCTYCWTNHYAKSIDDWIANNKTGCGKDKSRYFLNRNDYMSYVQKYKENNCQHFKKESQPTLFDIWGIE